MIVFKEDKARKILKTTMKLFIEGAEKQVLLKYLTPVLSVNFYIFRRKVTGIDAGLLIAGI